MSTTLKHKKEYHGIQRGYIRIKRLMRTFSFISGGVRKIIALLNFAIIIYEMYIKLQPFIETKFNKQQDTAPR